LLFGCASVVLLYLLANIAYLALLSFPEIQHPPQDRVAVAAVKAAFGNGGAICMAAAIMISTFGCDNGLILAGARVYFAMARDRLFFKRVATTNLYHVPASALIAQAIWTGFLTLPRTVRINPATHEVTYGNVYTQLLEYIISADLLFYLLIAGAVMVLRWRRPAGERPYRTWGYPLVPLLSIAIAALLIADLAFLAPATAGMGILIVLTGVPVYFFWRLPHPS
jgi:APA family basic amino acid/polyamine antiporter